MLLVSKLLPKANKPRPLKEQNHQRLKTNTIQSNDTRIDRHFQRPCVTQIRISRTYESSVEQSPKYSLLNRRFSETRSTTARKKKYTKTHRPRSFASYYTFGRAIFFFSETLSTMAENVSGRFRDVGRYFPIRSRCWSWCENNRGNGGKRLGWR